MTLSVEAETDVNFPFDYEALANRVILYTIEREGFPYEATIASINRDYRQIDRVTDVLSFPMLSYAAPGDFSGLEEDVIDNFNPDTGEVLLGDIVICVPKVFAQAEEFGHGTEREFAFLIVHSMLHLFGYDHMEPEEATFMENKQKKILEEMNILR